VTSKLRSMSGLFSPIQRPLFVRLSIFPHDKRYRGVSSVVINRQYRGYRMSCGD
jgi:hypothetical protein